METSRFLLFVACLLASFAFIPGAIGTSAITANIHPKAGIIPQKTKAETKKTTFEQKRPYAPLIGIAVTVAFSVIVACIIWRTQQYSVMIDLEQAQSVSVYSRFVSLPLVFRVLLVVLSVFILKILVVVLSLGIGYLTVLDNIYIEKLGLDTKPSTIELGLNVGFKEPLWFRFIQVHSLKKTKISVFARKVVSDGPLVAIDIPKVYFGHGNVSFDPPTDKIAIALSPNFDLNDFYQKLKTETNYLKEIFGYKFPVSVDVDGEFCTDLFFFPIRLGASFLPRRVFSKELKLNPEESDASFKPNLDVLHSISVKNDYSKENDQFEVFLEVILNLNKIKPALPVELSKDKISLLGSTISFASKEVPQYKDIGELEAVIKKTDTNGILAFSIRAQVQTKQMDNLGSFVQCILGEQNPSLQLRSKVLEKEMLLHEELETLGELIKNFDVAKSSLPRSTAAPIKLEAPASGKIKELVHLNIMPMRNNNFDVELNVEKEKIEGTLTFVKLANISIWPNIALEVQGIGYDSSITTMLKVLIKTETVDNLRLSFAVEIPDSECLAKTIWNFLGKYRNVINYDPRKYSAIEVVKIIPRRLEGSENDFYVRLIENLPNSLKLAEHGVQVIYRENAYDLNKATQSRLVKTSGASSRMLKLAKKVEHQLTIDVKDQKESLDLSATMILEKDTKVDAHFAKITWPNLRINGSIQGNDKHLKVVDVEIEKGECRVSLNPQLELLSLISKGTFMCSAKIGSSNAIDDLVRNLLRLAMIYSNINHFEKSNDDTLPQIYIDELLRISKESGQVFNFPAVFDMSVQNVQEGKGTDLKVPCPPKFLLNSIHDDISEPVPHNPITANISIAKIHGPEIVPVLYYLNQTKDVQSNWKIVSKVTIPSINSCLGLNILSREDGRPESIPIIHAGFPGYFAKFEMEAGAVRFTSISTEDKDILPALSRSGYIALPLKLALALDVSKVKDILQSFGISKFEDMSQLDMSKLDLRLLPVQKEAATQGTTFIDALLRASSALPLIQIGKLLKSPTPGKPSILLESEERIDNNLECSLDVASTGNTVEVAAKLLGSKLSTTKVQRVSSNIAIRQKNLSVRIGKGDNYILVKTENVHIPLKLDAGLPSYSEAPRLDFSIIVHSADKVSSANIRETLLTILSTEGSNFSLNIEGQAKVAPGVKTATFTFDKFKPEKIIKLALPLIEKISAFRTLDMRKLGKNNQSEKEERSVDSKRLLEEISIQDIQFEKTTIPCPFPNVCAQPKVTKISKVATVTMAYTDVIVKFAASRIADILSFMSSPFPIQKIRLKLNLKNPIAIRAAIFPELSGTFEAVVNPFSHEWATNMMKKDDITKRSDYKIDLSLGIDGASAGLVNFFSHIDLPIPSPLRMLHYQDKISAGLEQKSFSDAVPGAGNGTWLQALPPLTIRLTNQEDSRRNLLSSVISGLAGEVTVSNIISNNKGNTVITNIAVLPSKFNQSAGAEDFVFNVALGATPPIPIHSDPLVLTIATGGNDIVRFGIKLDLNPSSTSLEFSMLLLNQETMGTFLNRIMGGSMADFTVSLISGSGFTWSPLTIPLFIETKASIGEIIQSKVAEKKRLTYFQRSQGTFKADSDDIVPIFARNPGYSDDLITMNIGLRQSLVPKFVDFTVSLVGGMLGLENSNQVKALGLEKSKQVDLDILFGLAESLAWKDRKNVGTFIERLEKGALLPVIVKDRAPAEKKAGSGIPGPLTTALALSPKIKEIINRILQLSDDEGFVSKVDRKIGIDFKFLKLVKLLDEREEQGLCLLTKQHSAIEVLVGETFFLRIPLGGIKIPIGNDFFSDPCRFRADCDVIDDEMEVSSNGMVRFYSNWTMFAKVSPENVVINFSGAAKKYHKISIIVSKNTLKLMADDKVIKLDDEETIRVKGIVPLGEGEVNMHLQYIAYKKQLTIQFYRGSSSRHTTIVPVDFEDAFEGYGYSASVTSPKPKADLAESMFAGLFQKPKASIAETMIAGLLRMPMANIVKTKIFYSTEYPFIAHKPLEKAIYFMLRDSCGRQMLESDLRCRLRREEDERSIEATISNDRINGIYKCSSREISNGFYSLSLSVDGTTWKIVPQKLYFPGIW